MENSNNNAPSSQNRISYILAILSAFIPGIGLIVAYYINKNKEELKKTQEQLSALEKECAEKNTILDQARSINQERGTILSNARLEANSIMQNAHSQSLAIIEETKGRTEEMRVKTAELEVLRVEHEKLTSSVEKQKKRIKEMKLLYKAADETLDTYFRSSLNYSASLIEDKVAELERLYPEVKLEFKALEYPDLAKEFKYNQKIIEAVTDKYRTRYKVKTYRMLYELMTLALNAELQNLLYDLHYTNLENAKGILKAMLAKYRKIADQGNQIIITSIIGYLGEIGKHFERAIEIEYLYYVRKEQAKEEQRALKEQMRQEEAERKLLEEQKKQIVKEASKYDQQIIILREQISQTEDPDEISVFNNKIAELKELITGLDAKKEEIISLQNGKAGYVYIISNLGSFGENIFKIGMTRRLEPQERVNELGSASVPFNFDVHSFIFSDDAVNLETEIHRRLDSQRVNKVNKRKEFFNCSIDELELLVREIEPTAPFTKTMLAEQYYNSLEMAKTQNQQFLF